MNRLLFNLAVFFSLMGCTVGPDYQSGNADRYLLHKNWSNPLPHDGRVANLSDWWAQFHDPILTLLIERAEKDSPTLDVAIAKIEQARAVLEKAGATDLPVLNAGARSSRTRSDTGANVFYKSDRAASLDATWEIDLFGGQRRRIENARALLQSQKAGWHDARISLAAEVANAYTALRACENTAAILKSQLASRNETRKLVSYTSQTGISSPADETLAAASALESESRLEKQKGLCALSVNQLAYLVSIPQEELTLLLEKRTAMLPVPESVKIDVVPTAALQQRPDIMAAERALAAASAAIGVADAARYPALSLGGVIGVNKSTGSENTTSWSFGPALSLPVFNGGARNAEIRRTQAAFNETLGHYKAAIRAAVRETEDALASLNAARHRTTKARQSVEEYRKYLSAVESSYRSGTISLLDMEDARRLVYGAEESMIATQQETVESWIALYKSLGGGWQKATSLTGKERNP